MTGVQTCALPIFKRDIIRIITPGTVTERSMLEEGLSNYLAAVYLEGDAGAVAFCDISTGEFCAADFPENAATHILNELGRFSPREAVLSPGAVQNADRRDDASEDGSRCGGWG